MIRRTIETIRAFTGEAPIGWLGPGLTQTLDTVDHLAEAGIRYIGDWVLDDQPCPIQTRHGELVAMPYSVETNDIPIMAVQHHQSQVFLQRVTDSFDRLLAEGQDNPRVLCVAVHPFLSGVPHRIRWVEQAFEYMLGKPGVLFWTGRQILDWYRSQVPSHG